MISTIWKPLYVEDFDYEQYLYHYTSVEAAIKIISNNSLLFSRISNTNDTSESKMKIIFSQDNIVNKEDYRKKVDTIIDYFNKYHNVVQLLCFSTDAKITKTDRKKYLNSVNSKDMYYDISGRGFALPRMWAQYADNNKGVCFVFNKAKLLNIIKKAVAFYKCDSVKYKKFFNRYLIDSTQMQTIYDKTSMIANGSLTLIDMIQNDKAFLQYNFLKS